MPNYKSEQLLISIRNRVLELMRKKIADGKADSYAELAKIIKTTPQAVSKWTRGTGFPTWIDIVNIRNKLGVSFEYLLLGENPGESTLEQRVSNIEKILKVQSNGTHTGTPDSKRGRKKVKIT